MIVWIVLVQYYKDVSIWGVYGSAGLADTALEECKQENSGEDGYDCWVEQHGVRYYEEGE